MKNIERIRTLFLSGHVTEATNSEIVKITGIKPHQQVSQLTAKLVEDDFLAYTKHGREKVFFLAQDKEGRRVVNERDSTQRPESLKQASVYEKATVSDTSPVTDAERLLRIGFEEVGVWLLEGDAVKYRLFKHREATKLLYAFVAEGQVLYIGKSISGLAQRLNRYMNPDRTQKTNIKNHQKIMDVLREGKEVKIFVFSPFEDEIVYRGIPINLAAGLEDSLITRLQPLWNRYGKTG